MGSRLMKLILNDIMIQWFKGEVKYRGEDEPSRFDFIFWACLQPMHVCLKKAADLHSFGFHSALQGTLESPLLAGLYSRTENAVKCWGSLFSYFPVNLGVRIGLFPFTNTLQQSYRLVTSQSERAQLGEMGSDSCVRTEPVPLYS